MGITLQRQGHSRSTETKSRDLGSKVEWDRRQKALVVSAYGIKDFTSHSTHDYEIVIPRRECALILQTLADAVLEADQP